MLAVKMEMIFVSLLLIRLFTFIITLKNRMSKVVSKNWYFIPIPPRNNFIKNNALQNIFYFYKCHYFFFLKLLISKNCFI